jgi:hypothetical protein
MPLQIDRARNVPGAVYLRPTVRTSGLFGPNFDEPKFPLQLRITHNLGAQRFATGRDYLNNSLHSTLGSTRNRSLCNVCFDVKRGAQGAAVSSPPPGNPEIAPAWFHADTISRVTPAASGTSHTHRHILFPDAEMRRAKCQPFQSRVPAIDGSQGCSSKSHN